MSDTARESRNRHIICTEAEYWSSNHHPHQENVRHIDDSTKYSINDINAYEYIFKMNMY